MTENKKRYVYHQSRDFGSLIEDTKDNKCLHFMSQATEELNALHEENQNLKETLWEAEVNYIEERNEYSIDIEKDLEYLKKDWDREYWNDDVDWEYWKND